MKIPRRQMTSVLRLLAAMMLAGAPGADADVVTDANTKAADIASRTPATPIAVRAMAIVQVLVFEAVNAITKRHPSTRARISAAPGASVDAAIAAATRSALSKLMPTQQAAIDADYQAVLAALPDGPTKTTGVAVGEQAAAAILALRLDDGGVVPDTYRPSATAGIYVPSASRGSPLGRTHTLGDGPWRRLPAGTPAEPGQ